MSKLHTILGRSVLALILAGSTAGSVRAQGIHFSQFFNAPMLASPANTGLMTKDNYRVGVMYRNQWGAVPVPFSTFSAAGDLQLFRKENKSNWLGVGGLLLRDQSGEGSLSMTRVQLNLAYHIALGERQMISAGMGVSAINRNVNIANLMFDAQWDGFSFDPKASNRELASGNNSRYVDLSSGVSYSVFPNDRVYVKGSIAVDHINSPVETFFEGGNVVTPRTHAMIDARILLANGMILSPAVYYTTQQRAWEGVFGGNAQFPILVHSEKNYVILGAYHRLRDAIVLVAGYEYRQMQLTASYDYTVSGLGQYIAHNGAFEIGLSYKGRYSKAGAEDKLQHPLF